MLNAAEVRGKQVQLQRQPVFLRTQLPHDVGQVRVDTGMIPGIQFDVFPEKSHIGHIAAIDRHGLIRSGFLIVPVNLSLSFFNIGFQELDLLQLFDLFPLQVADAGNLQFDGPFNPPSARLLHAPPVLERVGDQVIGRNGSNGLVPVLDFYRIQIDFLYEAIGAVFGHLNPVADAHHVVGGYLDAGHKAQDGVLENQHQDGRGCPHGGDENPDGFTGKQGKDHQPGKNVHDDADHLEVTFQRFVFEGILGTQVIPDGAQHRADNPYAQKDHVDVGNHLDRMDQFREMCQDDWNRLHHDDQGDDPGNVGHGPVSDQEIIEMGVCLLS